MPADLKFAWRRLLKSPSFAITAILTLALGIGANAVVFSVLNALVLHTLNVPNAQRFYTIEERHETLNSYPDYQDVRDRNRSFDGVLAFNFAQVGLDNGGDPSPIWLYEASGNYFDTLGIQPYLGRFFHSSDEHGLNSSPYIVLSYAYWRSHFAGEAVIGRSLQLNKHPFTILGVAAPGFRGTESFLAPALWVPIVDQEQIEGLGDLTHRTSRSHWLIGRLKPGVTKAQGGRRSAFDLQFSEQDVPKGGRRIDLLDGASRAPGQPAGTPGPRLCDRPDAPGRAYPACSLRQPGQPFCRPRSGPFPGDCLAAGTRVEPSPHSAPASQRGSSGCRGWGIVGIAGSVVLPTRIERVAAAAQFPHQPARAPGCADLCCCVAVGLSERLALWVDSGAADTQGRPVAGSEDRLKHRDQRAVVQHARCAAVVQIALCAVLVTASLVAVRGLVRSLNSSFGFQPQNVLLVSTDLTMAGYHGDRVPVMQRRMLDGVANIPGVASVGLVDYVPLGLGWNETSIFANATIDLRESNKAAEAVTYSCFSRIP